MFEFFIWTESSYMNNIEILRMDTDSFIVKCKDPMYFNLIDNFLHKSKFNYKIELSKIILLLNFSRKSHFYSTISSKVLKVCGLQLSCYDRNYNIEEIVKYYINRWIDGIKPLDE